MDQTDNPPSRSRVVSPARPHGSFKPAALSVLAYLVTRLLGATLRFRLQDDSGQIRLDSPRVFLFAVWHNRIGIMPTAYRHYLRRTRLATLVSASRDGEILARTLKRFGFQPMRGSTSRRGPQSLLEMTRSIGDGFDAVITPDGPRGPAEVVQPGIVTLSKVTGVPITPVSCSVSRCIRLKSWDRFIVPLPFARCHIHVGKPIEVPRDADDALLEELRLRLQATMRSL